MISCTKSISFIINRLPIHTVLGYPFAEKSQWGDHPFKTEMKYRLGTIRDDFCENVLQENGFDINRLDRVSKLSTNLKKLKNKRIDFVVNSVEGTFIALEKEGYNPDDYVAVGILSDVPLSYAFHKDVPQELVDKFQIAIDSLEDARRKILAKYNLKEQKQKNLQ